MEATEYKDASLRLHERAWQTDRVVKAQMELTYRCNLHCRHCYTDPYNQKEYFPREMTLAEVRRILDEMADYGILWLNFSGGEAIARKDFFEIYEYAHRKGFLIVLYSNGTLLTATAIERLKKNPPFLIDISCHSIEEKAFDWFTQVPGSFQKFKEGIRLLKESGLEFDLKTKAMTWNKMELTTLRLFYESLGLTFGFTTSISPRLNGDCSSLEYRLPASEVKDLETREEIWIQNEATCRVASEWLARGTASLYRCGCGTDSIHINAWGELGTCTMEYQARASLRKLTLGEAIEKVFRSVRSLEYPANSACGSCLVHTFCEKSPTPASWETGKVFNPVRWFCDTAVDRAERLTHTKMEHPLK